jgi:hypothetical protein
MSVDWREFEQAGWKAVSMVVEMGKKKAVLEVELRVK